MRTKVGSNQASLQKVGNQNILSLSRLCWSRECCVQSYCAVVGVKLLIRCRGLLYNWRFPLSQCLIRGSCDFNHGATDAATTAGPLLSPSHRTVMCDAISCFNWKDYWVDMLEEHLLVDGLFVSSIATCERGVF